MVMRAPLPHALPLALAALTAAAGAGCGHQRAAPYRFRAPLVGSVAAADVAPGRSAPEGAPSAVPERAPADEPTATAAAATATAHPTTAEESSGGLADELRGLVGTRRDAATHVDFALDALERIGADLDPDLRGTHAGVDLMKIARARGAVSDGPPLLGDLVVFDGAVGDDRASLVGVVIRQDGGTIEFIHLTRDVVRRGYLNREHASQQRDAAGRATNTFVRHARRGDAKGTKYLAGELFSTYIRLDRLVD